MFHFARYAPNKFAGVNGFHPWFQVVCQNGSDETVVVDFLRSAQLADVFASRANVGRHV